MPNRESAIGVFDSGIGGRTVLQKIIETLPNENTVYLGDTARAPYGTKSVETVLRYSLENAAFLVQKGVKAVVVTYNTSTAVALPWPFDSCNRSHRGRCTESNQDYE